MVLMCHTDDSRPPAPPNPGEVAEHGELILNSADGAAFNAYRATPADPNGAKVVILPDVRGLHPYYRDLAQRFAEAGFATVAIDYFGRTAGIGERGDDFEWGQYVPQVKPEEVALDVTAAAEHLGGGRVFTVGFCFGGSQSWRLAAAGLGLAGVIGFYGRPSLVEDVVDRLSDPMLLLIAGADVATTPEEFAGFAAKLDAAGADYEMHTYEGAPHSFFDRSFAEWAPACDDAWRRVLAFTRRVS